VEDANQNGRIDGDNGDGIYGESETWEETSPNLKDSDGDTFSDKDEKDWEYNPLSKDTDGDGLSDDTEDEDGDGIQDSTETSAIKSDTDGDGLSDKMELDGWTVIVLYEATLEIKEEINVTSDPLKSDYDGDGINDRGEFENGTDPYDSDTDGDGFSDKEEIDFDYGSSPTGIDGQPPTITDFDASYEMNTEISGPLYDIKIVVEYNVVIKVSASDIFGVRWLKVHLNGVGEDIDYCGGASEFNNREFEFTLDVGQATRSLFKSFGVNITAEDINGNLGYKEDEVPSISDIIISTFTGTLTLIIKNIDHFLESLYEKILITISYIFSLDIINNFFMSSFLKYDYHMLKNDSMTINNYIDIISKKIGNMIKPILEYFESLKKDIEMIFLSLLDLFFINLNIEIDIDTKISLKSNAYNLLNIVMNIVGDLLQKGYWVDSIFRNIINPIINIIKNMDLDLAFSYFLNFMFLRDVDPCSIYSLKIFSNEQSKGFTEDTWFDNGWQAFSIVSLIIDVFFLIFNAVVAAILWPTFETGVGLAAAIGFTILALISIIPLVLDLISYNYFWGLSSDSVFDPSSKDVNDDRWELLITRCVVFPAISGILGFLVGAPLAAATATASWILSIPDGVNFLAGLLFYGDAKWI